MPYLVKEAPQSSVNAQPGGQHHADLSPRKDPRNGSQRLHPSSLQSAQTWLGMGPCIQYGTIRVISCLRHSCLGVFLGPRRYGAVQVIQRCAVPAYASRAGFQC